MNKFLLTIVALLFAIACHGQTISEAEFKRQALELEQTRTYLWKYASRMSAGNSFMLGGVMAAGFGALTYAGGNEQAGRPLLYGGLGSVLVGGIVNLSANFVLQKAGKRPGGPPPVYTER